MPLIDLFGSHHDRAAFDCGNDQLNRYFRTQAGQDLRKRVAVPFVFVDPDSGHVAGYYTLSAYLIDAGELPADVAKRAPRYPHLPATLLGRLAVDVRFQGKGVGRLLLVDALHRSLVHSKEIASLGIVVDAIDEPARTFYEHYGFIRFPERPFKLFLPMDMISKVYA